jgi:hypothetical protein
MALHVLYAAWGCSKVALHQPDCSGATLLQSPHTPRHPTATTTTITLPQVDDDGAQAA